MADNFIDATNPEVGSNSSPLEGLSDAQKSLLSADGLRQLFKTTAEAHGLAVDEDPVTGDITLTPPPIDEGPVEAQMPTSPVIHRDERTGRSIIQTGVNRDGAPVLNFAPVKLSDVIIPYDQ